MRIATFNVENLFDRPRLMNLGNWNEGKPILDMYAELNGLFEKKTYSAANKKRMKVLLKKLGLEKSDANKFVILRRIRGKILKRPSAGGLEIVAGGRDDWIGWLELKEASVNAIAIMNTGRVIRDVNADILAVIEAENRISLLEFSDYVLRKVGGTPYDKVMVIDGNDRRGIDVGLMVQKDYKFVSMRSHIHERTSSGRKVFSRDCPEYSIHTPGGDVIRFLVNHFKSKGYGSPATNNARRKVQAEHVAGYYKRLIAEGQHNVVVLGDLNDRPNSAPLKPLLQETDLKDVSEHPSFDTGQFAGKGTYGLGNDSNKLDYLLLSPALFNRVTAAGIFRKGAWPGKSPKRWSVYPELKKKIHIASDHHAVWVDLA